jgi:hypothetical protein
MDDLTNLISNIREVHRRRQQVVRARRRRETEIIGLCRRILNRPPTKEDKRRTFRKWVQCTQESAPSVAVTWMLDTYLDQHAVFAVEQKQLDRQLEGLAAQDPLAEFQTVPMLGLLSIGQIRGEIGDFTCYANPAKVWARAGVGIKNGMIQRRAKDKALAELFGFNPERRAIFYTISENVGVKSGRCTPKPYYRSVYEGRREHTAETHADWSKGHAFADAKRYTVKRLLRDMWQSEYRRSHGAVGDGNHRLYDIQARPVPPNCAPVLLEERG